MHDPMSLTCLLGGWRHEPDFLRGRWRLCRSPVTGAICDRLADVIEVPYSPSDSWIETCTVLQEGGVSRAETVAELLFLHGEGMIVAAQTGQGSSWASTLPMLQSIRQLKTAGCQGDAE